MYPCAREPHVPTAWTSAPIRIGKELTVFTNRAQGGRLLADALDAFAGRNDVVVLALPRGGVPVGYEIATKLNVPLDVFVVRKIGVPDHPELAMGALANDGTYVVKQEIIAALDIAPDVFLHALKEESRELQRREATYRDNRPEPEVSNKIIILTDDGLATGATMLVALEALRKRRPAKLIVAIPVAPAQTQAELRDVADEIVCLLSPEPFYSVGAYYRSFEQTTDEEVRDILDKLGTDKRIYRA